MPAVARRARSGELINRTYELLERLEIGPLCETYRATDRDRARAVTVKLLRPEFALQSGAVEAFLRAPRTLSAAGHPNFAAVIAIDTDATGIPFVVEECVEGEPLARMLERFPQGMPLDTALAMFTPLVDALVFAHARGLVHGQLDRDHVVVTMLGRQAVPKLLPGAAEAPRAQSGEGRAAGRDPRGDIRALGLLLHEMLFGRAKQRDPRVADEPESVDAARLPPGLAALVEDCKAERITTAEAVRAALLAACAPKPPAAPAPKREPVRSQAPRVQAQDPVSMGMMATMMAERPPAPFAAPTRPSPLPSRPTPTPVPRLAPSRPPPSRPTPTPVPSRPTPTPVPNRAKPAPKPSAAAPVADRASAPTLDRDPRKRPQPSPPSVPLEFPTVADADVEAAVKAQATPVAPAPNAATVEIKTLSDLVAAFAPIEGTERVGQADIAAPADEPEAKAPRPAPGKTAQRKGPVLSPKQLRDGVKPAAARPLSEEQLRVLRERGAEREGRYGRLLSALLFFCFAFLLVFAVPLLCDPTFDKAHARFGKHAPIAMAGFAALSLFALVRTWALQIQARPAMLGPVTLSLKVVTAAVCVLAAGFFLPNGMLGPAGRAAGWALPWGSGMFYLFLTLYGVTRHLRDAGTNPLKAGLTAVLYCAGLIGGYRVLATTVMVKRAEATSAQAQRQDEGSLDDKMRRLRAAASGQLPLAGAGAATDVAPPEKIVERHEVGGSERDDMEAIDAIGASRKRRASAMGQLHDQLKKTSR